METYSLEANPSELNSSRQNSSLNHSKHPPPLLLRSLLPPLSPLENQTGRFRDSEMATAELMSSSAAYHGLQQQCSPAYTHSHPTSSFRHFTAHSLSPYSPSHPYSPSYAIPYGISDTTQSQNHSATNNPSIADLISPTESRKPPVEGLDHAQRQALPSISEVISANKQSNQPPIPARPISSGVSTFHSNFQSASRSYLDQAHELHDQHSSQSHTSQPLLPPLPSLTMLSSHVSHVSHPSHASHASHNSHASRPSHASHASPSLSSNSLTTTSYILRQDTIHDLCNSPGFSDSPSSPVAPFTPGRPVSGPGDPNQGPPVSAHYVPATRFDFPHSNTPPFAKSPVQSLSQSQSLSHSPLQPQPPSQPQFLSRLPRLALRELEHENAQAIDYLANPPHPPPILNGTYSNQESQSTPTGQGSYSQPSPGPAGQLPLPTGHIPHPHFPISPQIGPPGSANWEGPDPEERIRNDSLTIQRQLQASGYPQYLTSIASTARTVFNFADSWNTKVSDLQVAPFNFESLPKDREIACMLGDVEYLKKSIEGIREIVHQAMVSERTRDPGRSHDDDPDIALYDSMKNSFAADVRKRRGRASHPGRCHSCNRMDTPEWRRGPAGARTLCNACGLHYAKLERKKNVDSRSEMGPFATI